MKSPIILFLVNFSPNSAEPTNAATIISTPVSSMVRYPRSLYFKRYNPRKIEIDIATLPPTKAARDDLSRLRRSLFKLLNPALNMDIARIMVLVKMVSMYMILAGLNDFIKYLRLTETAVPNKDAITTRVTATDG